MVRYLVLPAIATLIACDALAADAPEAVHTPAAVIGLGLSELRWGMRAEDIQTAYPALGMHRESDAAFRGAYRAFGCSFKVEMHLHGDSLDAVYLDTNDSGCSKEVKASLVSQYGSTEEHLSFLGITDLQWHIDFMFVDYSEYPSPKRIDIRFGDLRGANSIVQ